MVLNSGYFIASNRSWLGRLVCTQVYILGPLSRDNVKDKVKNYFGTWTLRNPRCPYRTYKGTLYLGTWTLRIG